MVPPIKPLFPLSDDDITNIGISYTLPIFTGFKLSKNISIASLNYEIAKAQTSLTKRQIEFNVYSIFLKGLSLKEQLKAKLEQEKALAELHKNVELGVKVGRYTAMDLKKWIINMKW
jgi:outer membrane protein TolC